MDRFTHSKAVKQSQCLANRLWGASKNWRLRNSHEHYSLPTVTLEPVYTNNITQSAHKNVLSASLSEREPSKARCSTPTETAHGGVDGNPKGLSWPSLEVRNRAPISDVYKQSIRTVNEKMHPCYNPTTLSHVASNATAQTDDDAVGQRKSEHKAINRRMWSDSRANHFGGHTGRGGNERAHRKKGPNAEELPIWTWQIESADDLCELWQERRFYEGFPGHAPPTEGATLHGQERDSTLQLIDVFESQMGCLSLTRATQMRVAFNYAETRQDTEDGWYYAYIRDIILLETEEDLLKMLQFRRLAIKKHMLLIADDDKAPHFHITVRDRQRAPFKNHIALRRHRSSLPHERGQP
uniref:Rep protein n=1 Tax=Steinernema glaseri TaxID=37863 RepID=A0A1I7YZH1_9BILA